MTAPLSRVPVQRMTGGERFVRGTEGLGFDLQSFWQWAGSDLLSNATRGRVAEYVVGQALRATEVDQVREEWAAHDLTMGTIKVEVKSAAYLQSWYQKKLSSITFKVTKTRAWNAETNEQDAVARRQADVYVFALLAHQDKTTINPLDVEQWEFYVVATRKLDARTRSQHSITLRSLIGLCPQSVNYADLAARVESEARAQKEQVIDPAAT
jgi:hypothetical protein